MNLKLTGALFHMFLRLPTHEMNAHRLPRAPRDTERIEMTKFERIEALDDLRANVAVPFEHARAMPKSVYTSQEFAKLEMEKIFAREWFCAGRASALANPGDYPHPGDRGPARHRRPRPRRRAPRHVERLPAPHVDAARGQGQHPRHRLPLSRLDLQSRRQPARRAGHEDERGSARRPTIACRSSAARSGSAGSW